MSKKRTAYKKNKNKLSESLILDEKLNPKQNENGTNNSTQGR
jgi:hypothetical protein